jgi:hypothetical protein
LLNCGNNLAPNCHINEFNKSLQSTLCGAILGTHRFQRAGVAGCALKSNGATRRDCTLEAMRTQGAFSISSQASFQLVDCIQL